MWNEIFYFWLGGAVVMFSALLATRSVALELVIAMTIVWPISLVFLIKQLLRGKI